MSQPLSLHLRNEMPVLQYTLLFFLASKIFAVGIAASLSWWWLILIYVIVSLGKWISTFVVSFITAAAVEFTQKNDSVPQGFSGIIQKK